MVNYLVMSTGNVMTVMPRRRSRKTRKLTGKETSLFEFGDAGKERLFCTVCHGEYNVKQQEGREILLECGHVVLREFSIACREMHVWNKRYGFPKTDGGWYDPPSGTGSIYPSAEDMERMASLVKSIIPRIRERMGKKWSPEV